MKNVLEIHERKLWCLGCQYDLLKFLEVSAVFELLQVAHDALRNKQDALSRSCFRHVDQMQTFGHFWSKGNGALSGILPYEIHIKGMARITRILPYETHINSMPRITRILSYEIRIKGSPHITRVLPYEMRQGRVAFQLNFPAGRPSGDICFAR